MQGTLGGVLHSARSGPTAQPTLSAGFQVRLQGWDAQGRQDAHSFGAGIVALAEDFSRVLDLSRLKSIVIAWDYPKALAELGGGVSGAGLGRTDNEYGEGGAMSVAHQEGDTLWNTVVIWTPLVQKILDKGDPGHRPALQALAHELIHVDDQRLFSRTFPGGWQAARPRDARDEAMQAVVNPCQSEYSAQRRSAHIWPEGGRAFLDLIGETLQDVDHQILVARQDYSRHLDATRLWIVTSERLRFLFQVIGYGLGHADYIASAAQQHPDLAAVYAREVDGLCKMRNGWLLNACRDAVQPFFYLREWTDYRVYDGLEAVLERMLNQYGVATRLDDGALHLDILDPRAEGGQWAATEARP